jgi:FkbM family methyltransferase
MQGLSDSIRAIGVRVADIWDEPSWRERWRAARRFVAFNLRTRVFKLPTVAPLGERSKILAYPGETNSPLAAYRNPPNPYQMNVWKRHLKPGDLFVDVGANVGIYTIYALDLGARVISCEADAHSHERLLEHLALNGYEAEVLNMAIADTPGTLRFTRGLDSLNHLVLDDNGDDGVDVPATTLDDVLGDRHAAGVKIDVEGAEPLVLAGAARALAEHRIDIIQFEWAGHSVGGQRDDRSPVTEMLRDAGYVLFRPEADGSLVLLEGDVEVHDDQARRDVFALAPKTLHPSMG